MKIKDISQYIEMYDMERYLFSVVGASVRGRGYLSFDEFYKICMWKSARQKQRYILNKETIEEISKTAFLLDDETIKIELLCQLKGVGVPTASAILTVVFPDKYAVIDIRCIDVLRSSMFGYQISKYISVKTWIEYLKIMRELAQENGVTPRELDMTLFAMHKKQQEREDYRNLY